jgi:hypothetical protein
VVEEIIAVSPDGFYFLMLIETCSRGFRMTTERAAAQRCYSRLRENNEHPKLVT